MESEKRMPVIGNGHPWGEEGIILDDGELRDTDAGVDPHPFPTTQA